MRKSTQQALDCKADILQLMHLISGGRVLDPGVAGIISSGITTVGAVSAVLLGWFFFSGKVKDLKTAIDNSDGLLQRHQESMTDKFEQIAEKVDLLDNLFNSKLAGLGKIESAVDDLQKVSSDIEGVARQSSNLDTLKQDWLTIRDTLENVAAATKDGRTRARYARIDRRQYKELIEALGQDGRLGSLRPSFVKALDLWHRYRGGRAIPTPEDVQAMDRLEKTISAAAAILLLS